MAEAEATRFQTETLPHLSPVFHRLFRGFGKRHGICLFPEVTNQVAEILDGIKHRDWWKDSSSFVFNIIIHNTRQCSDACVDALVSPQCVCSSPGFQQRYPQI